MSALPLGTGRKLVLGMLHLRPLPGTPFHEPGSFEPMLRTAVASAIALRDGGADGCLVQSVDRVYSVADESDPARTAAMALIVRAVREAVGPAFPVGVHLMRNALRASLAVAKVAGGDFVRAGALVGRTLTVHGMVEADPLGAMAYRKAIDAWDVAVIAEVDSPHFRMHGMDLSTGQVAKAAAAAGADAVSVGDRDEDRTLAMIASVREHAPGLPVVLTGHTNFDNAARLMVAADGAFVGSCLEPDGWGGAIDVQRVRAYVDIVRELEK